MLHVLKKKVKLHTSRVDPGAEFQDFKLRLDVVKKNLSRAEQQIENSHKNSLQYVLDQRVFCTSFMDGYPTSEDDTYAKAREFAEDAMERYEVFVRQVNADDAPFRKSQRELQVYIKEIEAVESHYPNLLQARSEFDRYQAKVDAMDKSSKTDDVKRARNRQKRDAEREKLDELTDSVIEMQKRTYAKSVMMHRVALVSFWAANAKHLEIMNSAVEKSLPYVRDNEEDVQNVDVVMWYGDPASHPRLPERKPSSPKPNMEPSLSEWGSSKSSKGGSSLHA
jgi:hypothetical protein